MGYQIGKVFSDSVLDRLASRADRRSDGHAGSVTRTRNPKVSGGGSNANLEAAKIRAATADKDRAARTAGQEATISARREGASARERAAAIAAAGQRALGQVKTAQDGLRLIAWMQSKAREKDAYGRVDPDLAQRYPLLRQPTRYRRRDRAFRLRKRR